MMAIPRGTHCSSLRYMTYPAADSPGRIAESARNQEGLLAGHARNQVATEGKRSRRTTVLTTGIAAVVVIATSITSVIVAGSSATRAIRATADANLNQLLVEQRISAHADYLASAAAVLVAAQSLDGTPRHKDDAAAIVARLDTARVASYAPHGRVTILAGEQANLAANKLNKALSDLGDSAQGQFAACPAGADCMINVKPSKDTAPGKDVYGIALCLRDLYAIEAKIDVRPDAKRDQATTCTGYNPQAAQASK